MDRTEASWIGLVDHAFELEPDPQFQHHTDEQLELEVRGGASKIAAMMARWLLHIGEFVVRGAWGEQGARTPGQWLSWACGVDGRTGRE